MAALLTMSIDTEGALQLDAVGIEPEHAATILGDLNNLREQLQEFLAEHIRPPPKGKVVPIRK